MSALVGKYLFDIAKPATDAGGQTMRGDRNASGAKKRTWRAPRDSLFPISSKDTSLPPIKASIQPAL
jgi:hypothetical protein